MSIRNEVWVACDNCGECAFPSRSALEARRDAKRLGGWVHWNNKDFCSNCKAQMVIKKDYIILPDTTEKP